MSKQAVKPPGADRPALRLPELNARIRARRSQLGLTGAELAQRSGISPSYVSLIESGAKVPDDDVAAQLARTLDDDEDLYRALARAARLGPEKLDLLSRLGAASRTPAYLSLVESGQTVPKLADSNETDDLALRMREVAGRLSSPPPLASSAATAGASSAVVSVPVLAEGADPIVLDGAEPTRAIVDSLLVERRLLGPAARDLFAYDLTPRGLGHLRGVAEAGDRLVFQRPAVASPDRICAVRRAGGLLLSRVLWNGRTLLLLPGDGESGFDSIDVPDQKVLGHVLVGSHVLLIRR
jgi:DNA-binding XRE family transcriptional regulator